MTRKKATKSDAKRRVIKILVRAGLDGGKGGLAALAGWLARLGWVAGWVGLAGLSGWLAG